MVEEEPGNHTDRASPFERVALRVWALGASIKAKGLIFGLVLPMTFGGFAAMLTQIPPYQLGRVMANPMLAGLVTSLWAYARKKPWAYTWFGFGWRWFVLCYVVFLFGSQSRAGHS